MGEYLTGPNDGRPLKTQDWMLEEGWNIILERNAALLEVKALREELRAAMDAAIASR